jgi:hypothetical protein
MPPSRYITWFRATITAAVLVMAAVIGWRISTPVAGLLDAYRVHVSLTTPHPSPHPSRPPSYPACPNWGKIAQLSR